MSDRLGIRTGHLYDLLRSRFPDDLERPALLVPDAAVVRYADLDRESARYANLIVSLGVEPGDRVAVQVDKSAQAFVLYLACLRAGAAYLPMNVAYKDAEVAHIVGDARPRLMVCRPQNEADLAPLCEAAGISALRTLDAAGDGSFADEAEDCDILFETRARGSQDLAALLYTSGTTGMPKGVMLTQENLASNAQVLFETWGWREDDVLLHALPLFHTHGLFVASHCALMGGTAMIFLPKFDIKQILEGLRTATVFMGVPTFYTRLLATPEFEAKSCENIRLFVSGSAPLLEQTFSEFQQRTGQDILERYGMTETGMNTSNPLDGARKLGTVGLPLDGVDVRIVDEQGEPVAADAVGQLEVKGPNVFSGYWEQPDKTAEDFTDDGYFRTGDLGRLDEDGYVVLVGRSKDLVISGGYNVYPKEVELLIDEIPGVEESAVIGLPDADLGESVTAVIVADAAGPVPDADDIIARLKGSLAGYKVPKRVVFYDTLPRNAMGKVQKNLLRAELSELSG